MPRNTNISIHTDFNIGSYIWSRKIIIAPFIVRNKFSNFISRVFEPHCKLRRVFSRKKPVEEHERLYTRSTGGRGRAVARIYREEARAPVLYRFWHTRHSASAFSAIIRRRRRAAAAPYTRYPSKSRGLLLPTFTKLITPALLLQPHRCNIVAF